MEKYEGSENFGSSDYDFDFDFSLNGFDYVLLAIYTVFVMPFILTYELIS